MSPFMSIAITQDTFVRFELIVNGRVGRLRNHECNLVQGVRLFGRESSRHLRGRRDILLTLHRRDETQSLKHSFKKVSISHAQLAHFSTLAREKHMLLIVNFSTLTFITNDQKGLCISCAARTLQHTCKRNAHASHLELLHTHIYHKC